MSARFVVARNPDDASTLPYLLRIPVAGPPLLLKARDAWPRTSKVFCHPLEHWPDDPDVVEEVDVLSCQRRGRAVDLVLDRGQLNRSQFVFVTLRGGREAVFWQTSKTAAASRPGLRIPSRRAAGIADLEVIVDTRERYGYRFAAQQATTRRAALRAGDYAVELDGDVSRRWSASRSPTSSGDWSTASLRSRWRSSPHSPMRRSSWTADTPTH